MPQSLEMLDLRARLANLFPTGMKLGECHYKFRALGGGTIIHTIQNNTASIIILLCMQLIHAAPATAQDNLRLWDTDNISAHNCRNFAAAIGAEQFDQVIQGYKWPHASGGGAHYIEGNAKHLNAAAIGRANDKKFAARILSAARSNAFTKLDFEGPGGSSPAFVSAIIVKSTAYAVSYLRSKNALNQSELTEIDVWVRRLIKNSDNRPPGSGYYAHSLDHQAAIMLAQLMWGAAVEDAATFRKGQREVLKMLKRLKRNPYFVSDLRNNNEVMHHMVHAGMLLQLNRIKVFDIEYGKNTFNDAVSYHSKRVILNGTKKIKTQSDAIDPPRSIMRSQGFGTHLAWIPVYLSAQGASAASSAVKALSSELRKIDRKPYWGMQMGVHAGCLYGR